MNKTFLAAATALLLCCPSFGWSRLGHAAVAKIAEENLTKMAKEKVTKYLKGASAMSPAFSTGSPRKKSRKSSKEVLTIGLKTALNPLGLPTESKKGRP